MSKSYYEQELVDDVKQAEATLTQARTYLDNARKKLLDVESNFIYAKLQLEKKRESLRIFRAQQVQPGEQYSLYDDEL